MIPTSPWAEPEAFSQGHQSLTRQCLLSSEGPASGPHSEPARVGLFPGRGSSVRSGPDVTGSGLAELEWTRLATPGNPFWGPARTRALAGLVSRTACSPSVFGRLPGTCPPGAGPGGSIALGRQVPGLFLNYVCSSALSDGFIAEGHCFTECQGLGWACGCGGDFFFFFFWPCPWHVEVSGPGVESAPQQ